MRRPHVERLSSGAYSARISDPTRPGVRIRITDDTEAKVLARVERSLALAREIRAGVADPRDVRRRFAKVAIGAPTIDEVWASYEATLRGQWRKKVGSIWRAQIAPNLGGARVFELNPERMASWERWSKAEGRGPKTIQNAFVALRAAMRAALHERVEEIPWRTWRPQGPPVGYEPREACRSVAELEALVMACARYDAEAVQRVGALGDLAVRVLVLALCGLRQGEAVALGWDALAIDGEDGDWTMTVKAAAHEDWKRRPGATRPLDPPKGNKIRTQALHAHAAAALRHQRERLRGRGIYRPDGPVFPTREGEWRAGSIVVEPDVFRRVVEAAALPTEAGKTWTPHSLRHTFATLETWAAWSLTGDVQAAMARTGHTKMETLMGYLRRAGRGRPAAFIPALSGGAAQVALGLPPAMAPAELGPAGEVAHGALANVANVAIGRAAAVEPEPNERAKSLRELAQGAKAGEAVPDEVRRRAEAAYRKAYLVAQRSGAAPEACRQRGGAAKRAFLGAWGKVRGRTARVHKTAGKEGP